MPSSEPELVASKDPEGGKTTCLAPAGACQMVSLAKCEAPSALQSPSIDPAPDRAMQAM